ncbi:hypothetical protein G6011_07644 [Alternaria panax]|uniref:C2H2-type domain-containing protein n=1 Tax=Alternaria panax TaxID=48097 RepID=A0AAD4I104_9PLEO|nr:hypothetical protein G6011_07644 [Alternaria panax]
MSEPTKTGGLPLDSKTYQQQQPKGSIVHQPTSPSVEYWKTSQSPNNVPKESKATSPRRRPGIIEQAPSGPHTGPSRPEQQPALSPTDMSSHNSSIHYTRTGRISKAKKGLKVHNCENCGRSYTRAEHLRRHQKNYAQEDAHVCQVLGCGKTFFRIDLLQRHKERHNEPGRDSPQQSPEGSPEPASIPMPALQSPMMEATTNPPATSYYQPVSPMLETAPFTSQLKHPRSQYNRSSVAVPVPMDGMTPGLWHEPYSPTPGYSSSSGYASPIASTDFPTFGSAPYHRARTPSNASIIDPSWSYQSRSPASTTSTMAFTWGSNDKGSTAPNLAYTNACSFPMTTIPIPTSMDAMAGYGHFSPRTMTQRDEEEGIILFGEEQYGMASIAYTYPFEQYLDYYWRLFHPTFPVVHRFTSMSRSPMLYAAMIAIGCQYSIDSCDKRKGRDLHDRCIKLLERRDCEASTEPDRLCDFQTIFLIEVLSQYRARRAAKILSTRFDKLYHKTIEDCRSMTPKMADLVASLSRLEHVTADHWAQWVNLATWQRLFLSCYVLESQQRLLLARECLPSIIHDFHFNIPFPAHSSLWDASSLTEWTTAAQQHPHTPSYVCEVTSGSISIPLDTFQSSIILAAHYSHHETSIQHISSSTSSDLESLLDSAPVTTRMLPLAKLVQVTPIRALLAIAGKSWIFSEKVATPQAFAELKTTLRTWVAQLWSVGEPGGVPVKEALKLSIKILQQAVEEQRDCVPLEMGTDMGIFFAALVLWVITVAANTRTKGPHQAVKQQTRRQGHSESPKIFNSTWAPESPSAQPVGRSSSSSVQRTLAPSNSQPQSPNIEATPENSLLSHAQIIINTISFLTDTLAVSDDTVFVHQSPADLARCQAGCVSLLLWVKLRLRGVPLGDQIGAADAWINKPDDGLGELLEGVIGSIEHILDKGWSDWGI